MQAFEGWCISLAGCYYAVVLLCIVQIVRIAYHGHQLRSFRVGFLLLSTTWMALKGTFWLNEQSWSLLGLVVFSELPPCGQMASYLFFLIFCAQHVHRESWAVQGPRCWLGFTLANLATLGSVVGFTIPALIAKDSDSSASTIEQHRETHLGVVFSAAIYTVLGASLAIYAWLIWNQPDAAGAGAQLRSYNSSARGGVLDNASVFTQISFKTGFAKNNSKVSGIVPVLFAASAIFLLRAVYDLLLMTSFVGPITIEQDQMKYVVPFYLLTDIFPTLLLLVYFRAIPTKPPRPRHIPSASSDAGMGLLASPRAGDRDPHFDVDSSIRVATMETVGVLTPPKPGERSLRSGSSAGKEGGTRDSRPLFGSGSNHAAVTARSFPAFDPFKGDSGQLPAAFGARRSGAESVASSTSGGQQLPRRSVSRV